MTSRLTIVTAWVQYKYDQYYIRDSKNGWMVCGKSAKDKVEYQPLEQKSKSKGSQGRLDSFFKVTSSMPKRKPEMQKGKKGKKVKTGPYANR